MAWNSTHLDGGSTRIHAIDIYCTQPPHTGATSRIKLLGQVACLCLSGAGEIANWQAKQDKRQGLKAIHIQVGGMNNGSNGRNT